MLNAKSNKKPESPPPSENPPEEDPEDPPEFREEALFILLTWALASVAMCRMKTMNIKLFIGLWGFDLKQQL
jgi:hypothetical protein